MHLITEYNMWNIAHKNWELKEEIENSTTLVEDFNNTFSVIDMAKTEQQ